MGWKKILIVSIGIGIGLGIGLAVAIGGVWWYQGRPRPWNSKAVNCIGRVAVSVDDDPKFLVLWYDLENITNQDFEMHDFSSVKITTRYTDGTQSEPMPDSVINLKNPVFIPAHQKSGMRIRLNVGSTPAKKPGEIDADYTKRLRSFTKDEVTDTAFSIFDPFTKYQIELIKFEK